jgi:hypothetical protein
LLSDVLPASGSCPVLARLSAVLCEIVTWTCAKFLGNVTIFESAVKHVKALCDYTSTFHRIVGDSVLSEGSPCISTYDLETYAQRCQPGSALAERECLVQNPIPTSGSYSVAAVWSESRGPARRDRFWTGLDRLNGLRSANSEPRSGPWSVWLTHNFQNRLTCSCSICLLSPLPIIMPLVPSPHSPSCLSYPLPISHQKKIHLLENGLKVLKMAF